MNCPKRCSSSLYNQMNSCVISYRMECCSIILVELSIWICWCRPTTSHSLSRFTLCKFTTPYFVIHLWCCSPTRFDFVSRMRCCSATSPDLFNRISSCSSTNVNSAFSITLCSVQTVHSEASFIDMRKLLNFIRMVQ